MKKFIEKLIGRLEEAKESAKRRNAFDSEVSYACAIDIVNKLAEEFAPDINVGTKVSEMPTGWIPCSSGYFSTSEVLVCKEDGTIDFDVYDFMDNDWKFNSNHHKNKVIAWQPLPALYTEGE